VGLRLVDPGWCLLRGLLPRKCPNQYGGIATLATLALLQHEDPDHLGNALISTVGLRHVQEGGKDGNQILLLGNALISTVGLRLGDSDDALVGELMLGKALISTVGLRRCILEVVLFFAARVRCSEMP